MARSTLIPREGRQRGPLPPGLAQRGSWRRRVGRYLTNPEPGPGQAWELDGVGPVEVVKVTGEKPEQRVHLADADGGDLVWMVSQFRTQADLTLTTSGKSAGRSWIMICVVSAAVGSATNAFLAWISGGLS